MKRVNIILADENYRIYLLKNKALEEHRQFCTHNFDHMLVVARITFLLLLEENCRLISREVAYAAGLLHDIGRWKEYQDGTDHALYSSKLAGPILDSAGFHSAEKELITRAIAQHRDKISTTGHRSPLSRALSKADAMARLCFNCTAIDECKCANGRPHRQQLLY